MTFDIRSYDIELLAEDTPTALSDWRARSLLKKAKKNPGMVKCWRLYAKWQGYKGPIAWNFPRGDAPPLKYVHHLIGESMSVSIQEERRKLADALIFWVPRIAPMSREKTYTEMHAHREFLKRKFDLPDGHGESFGSIGLIALLCGAHFFQKVEAISSTEGFYAMSETLELEDEGFSEVRLHQSLLAFNDGQQMVTPWCSINADPQTGFFLLGIEHIRS